VHSGQVVAGNIGSQDHMKYGVVGPPVNVTGRIEALTVGPQVLLSESTLERVRHLVGVGPGTAVAVKGVPEPVVVYELQRVAGEESLDGARGADAALAAVDLPATARVVDETKRVDEAAYAVRVTRIGREAVELVTRAPLPPSRPDLLLAVDFGDGALSGGSYVRVAAREPAGPHDPAALRIRAVFTSLAESDRAHIDRLVAALAAGSGPEPVLA
jgi:hypothetical protein